MTVYEQFYSHSTMSTDLDNARSQCNTTSILCAAGGLVNSDILDLVACGNCYAVLSPTTLNSPVFVGSVYWYMTAGKSFGFSPNSIITKNSADI